MQAATTLGADEPEVAGWVESARAILTRLRAAPLLEQLERIVAEGTQPSSSAATSAAVPAQSRPA